MRKVVLVTLSLLAGLSLIGCSKEQGPTPQKSGVDTSGKEVAGAPAAKKVEGFVGVIRDARLDALPTNTIGGAFDAYQYFETRDWIESRAKDGQIVVDCYCKLKESSLTGKDREAGVLGRGLDVKFVINSDGSYRIDSISRYDSKAGGKIEPHLVADIGSILPNIYANKALTF